MNWESISAISEFVAALAVIVSLIYLAAQVRSGADTFKTSLRDSAFTSLMEYNYAILADPDLSWIFQKGMRDFASLDEQQRARAIHVFYAFFKLFENMYLHYLSGSIDADIWKTNSKVLFAFAAFPGGQGYLEERLPIFDPRYQQLLKKIERVESKSDDFMTGVYSTEA